MPGRLGASNGEASNLSKPEPSGADQIDAEHQATDLKVGIRIPRGAYNRRSQTQLQVTCLGDALIAVRGGPLRLATAHALRVGPRTDMAAGFLGHSSTRVTAKLDDSSL